jgi:DNA-binding CsgD family transcriptional regulator
MSLRDTYFTPRQVEIIWHIYNHPGENHKQMALHLGIARSTLNTHLRMIYAAAEVNSDLELIVELFKCGWFSAQPRRRRVPVAARG